MRSDKDDTITIGSIAKFLQSQRDGTYVSDDQEVLSVKELLNSTTETDRLEMCIAELTNASPILIDKDTAYGVYQLKENGDERLYQIILNDISNAYAVIHGQLYEIFSNWENQFMLKDINVNLITDNDVWKRYVYVNELENLVLPGCSSSIVPICLRFRKKDPGVSRLTVEIEFFDVICMMAREDCTKRVQMVSSKYIQNYR